MVLHWPEESKSPCHGKDWQQSGCHQHTCKSGLWCSGSADALWPYSDPKKYKNKEKIKLLPQCSSGRQHKIFPIIPSKSKPLLCQRIIFMKWWSILMSKRFQVHLQQLSFRVWWMEENIRWQLKLIASFETSMQQPDLINYSATTTKNNNIGITTNS